MGRLKPGIFQKIGNLELATYPAFIFISVSSGNTISVGAAQTRHR
ncbi:hypothetical protein [Nostoc sp. NOS(2021)]|nr:hypothetical protein [Nostoc sp. NOS(2021)]